MKKSPGFTLIEIMIVLVILGLGLTLGISKLTNRSGELRAVLRKTVVLSRELHVRSKLNGVTYRLVIDLGEGGPNSSQSIWVEKGSSASVVKTSSKEVEKNLNDRLEEDVTPKEFSKDSTLLKEDLKLPRGMYFREVEISRVKGGINKGIAYIHYMPQGLAEESAIHIESTTNKQQKWTISIHPLTGRAEVLSPSMRLEDLQEQ